jgi:hypothetical protein
MNMSMLRGDCGLSVFPTMVEPLIDGVHLHNARQIVGSRSSRLAA